MGAQGLAGIGSALNDRKRSDLLAKEGASRLKESEQIQLLNQRKIDDDTKRRELIDAEEVRGALAPMAQEGKAGASEFLMAGGAPAPMGTAVDFQAVKMANKHDSDAKLWNMANKDKPDFLPLSGGALRKMMESKSLDANLADQSAMVTGEKEAKAEATKAARDTFKFGEEKLKAGRDAAESKAGLAETAARVNLLGAQADKAGTEAKVGPQKPPTESQANSALFGRRLELAMRDMEQVKAGGYDATTIPAGLGRTLQKLPGGNMTASDGAQRQRNAETNFLTAILRKESGASISPTEFKGGEELYFDRTGDSQTLKEQKARNRMQAMEGLKAGAGPAWETVNLTPPGDAGNLGDLTDDDLDAKLRAKGIDPATGQPLRGGASGTF